MKEKSFQMHSIRLGGEWGFFRTYVLVADENQLVYLHRHFVQNNGKCVKKGKVDIRTRYEIMNLCLFINFADLSEVKILN